MRPIPLLALALLPVLARPRAAGAQDGFVDLSAPAPGRVPLHLRSRGAPLHVVVERRVTRPPEEARARGVVWGAARCETPCTVWVPPGVLRLRANAPDVRATDEDLDVPAEGATVHVRAGRAGLHNLGIGLLAAGATTLIATMFVALADQGIFNGTTRGSLGLEPASVVGAASAGAALLAAGIPLMLLHRNGLSVSAVAGSARLSLSVGATFSDARGGYGCSFTSVVTACSSAAGDSKPTDTERTRPVRSIITSVGRLCTPYRAIAPGLDARV
ncbi:MAG: hypothetical protein U0325_22315 [Polyangiales bacterium]